MIVFVVLVALLALSSSLLLPYRLLMLLIRILKIVILGERMSGLQMVNLPMLILFLVLRK